MQIRQILTAIIVFTALVSMGLTATVFLVRDKASSDFRLANEKQIFQSRLDQLLSEIEAQLQPFGPEGARSSFFSETNDTPLDYTRNTANYFNNMDLTAEVRNPIHKNILDNKPELNRRYFIPFYAQGLAKSELSFYATIDPRTFETLACRQSPRSEIQVCPNTVNKRVRFFDPTRIFLASSDSERVYESWKQNSLWSGLAIGTKKSARRATSELGDFGRSDRVVKLTFFL